jgi:hypothetical protein
MDSADQQCGIWETRKRTSATVLIVVVGTGGPWRRLLRRFLPVKATVGPWNRTVPGDFICTILSRLDRAGLSSYFVASLLLLTIDEHSQGYKEV